MPLNSRPIVPFLAFPRGLSRHVFAVGAAYAVAAGTVGGVARGAMMEPENRLGLRAEVLAGTGAQSANAASRSVSRIDFNSNDSVVASLAGQDRPVSSPTSNPSTPPATRSAPVPASASPSPATEQAADSEPKDEAPPITLDPPILDFGIVPPSETKSGVVKLINTGTKPLEILTVQPSCKCTTLEDISGKVIPVGGFIELKTEMKAQSSPGSKRAEVKVLVDGYTQVVNILLRNEVSLPVRVSPAYLNVVPGQPESGRLVVESIDRQPFRICSVGGKPPVLVGFDPSKDEPRNQYLLDWDFKRDFPEGKAPRYWLIETDRADAPLIDIYVRHESTFPKVAFKFSDYRYTFGRMEEGKSYEFTVEVSEIADGERIVTAATTKSNAKLDFLGTESDGTHTKIKLRVTPNPGVVGLTYVPFTIYSNKRQQELTVWGQVVPKGTTGCFGR